MIIVCPNHAGAFDCSPFCELCEGQQEYEKKSWQQIKMEMLLAINNLEREAKNV
tara:strand:- start:1019 stop:1180 length:162 start_codon:yes stop_codon:yes gene_type:complete